MSDAEAKIRLNQHRYKIWKKLCRIFADNWTG